MEHPRATTPIIFLVRTLKDNRSKTGEKWQIYQTQVNLQTFRPFFQIFAQGIFSLFVASKHFLSNRSSSFDALLCATFVSRPVSVQGIQGIQHQRTLIKCSCRTTQLQNKGVPGSAAAFESLSH